MDQSQVSNAVVNTSGLHPKGRAVLVKPYDNEKLGAGVLVRPESYKQIDMMVNQRGVVIEVGPEAWKGELSPRAKLGEHVVFARYAGFLVANDLSRDGAAYRLVNDNDIFCGVEVAS